MNVAALAGQNDGAGRPDFGPLPADTASPAAKAGKDAHSAGAPVPPVAGHGDAAASRPGQAGPPASQSHASGKDVPQAAAAAFKRGMELRQATDFLGARTELSKAYFWGDLPADKQDEARKVLTDLAELTLIGRGSKVYPNDPYTGYYLCKAGDILAAVDRREKLHVPWQLLVRVNNMQRPEDLVAGQRYKVVNGPFHAIIYKTQFVMDLYLQRDELPKLFIKRVRIGTGKDGATPNGMWRVKLGGKHERPTWYPPPNSPHHGPIPYGHPDYAFGAKGLWISLEGLDENTKPLTDYGIHSTSAPDSIGKAESLGCIRLGDDDIDLVYMLLYEYYSTIEVRP